MNDKKLKKWDEQGGPDNLVNDGLFGSELEIIVNCGNARLKIVASNGDSLKKIIELTDAILSRDKK